MPNRPFDLIKTCPSTRARRGRLRTAHGVIETPVFMPVGTQGTVKSQTREMVREAGAQIVLANTYHLVIRPGLEVLDKFGGIHRFMNWDKPVLTDSGGYQVFSLPHARSITEDGAFFRSYLDGTPISLTPEESIRAQLVIGSDIMMAFDQCVPSTCPKSEALEAMERTHRWAKRSLAARGESKNLMFGIVQGACFRDLRKQSADVIASMPFDGLAVGGLAVGETKDEREDTTAWVTENLPSDRPRYLMGVGTPIDLLEAVARGIDMFDCIIPTSYAQRGVAFTSLGKVQIRRGAYRLSEERLDPSCSCATCRDYSCAYLHHLIRSSEPLGWTLLARHNLHFYHSVMQQIRDALDIDQFESLYRKLQPILAAEDPRHPIERPKSHQNEGQESPRLEEGQYEVSFSEAGHANIRSTSCGERMHSVSDPIEEARRLYVNGSGLRQALEEAKLKDARTLVWDVGLGAAANAIAAIECAESVGAKLEILSFEEDLDSLRLALRNVAHFKYLEHPSAAHLLSHGEWHSKDGKIIWKLFEGDLRERLFETAAPHFIFFDPFSQKTQPELWSLNLFEKIHSHCREADTRLITYSSSTAVRAGLLFSGFLVGQGVQTGPKESTTIAFTQATTANQFSEALLKPDWIKRWERSDNRYPALFKKGEHTHFETRLRAHPQFVLPLANSNLSGIS